jgi:DNA-binding transcriptional MerR regulator
MTEPGIYSIGALARMLGISPTTLRSWEERYGVVVPERSAGSQRLYSRDQLDQLRFVCQQMELGLSAADAHRALAERLTAGTSRFAAERDEQAERRILLVERDPYAADLEEYFLRTEGYDVHVARAIPDAERLLGEQVVDLVIVDLMIGGGAGLRLCQRLGDTLRVLAVSALDQHERAIAAGADAFIRKPFEPLTLVSATRDLVGTSAMVRNSRRVPSE